MNIDFTGIVGHDEVKRRLALLTKNKELSHTLLFHGVDGIGKGEIAKRLALFLFGSLEEQRDKKRIEEESHPDLHMLRPEGKSSQHSIASIRSFITEIGMQPFEAKSKVFIIDDAHRMAKSSANALLKTLEEPSEESYIILITDQLQMILPTIISRCFLFRFTALSDKEIKEYLEAKDPDMDLDSIVKLSHGSLTSALAIYDHPGYDEMRKCLLEILSREKSKDQFQLISAIEQLETFFINADDSGAFSYKQVDLLFTQILMWFRDLHLIYHKAQRELLFFQEEKERLFQAMKHPFPSMEKVDKKIQEAKSSVMRNIKHRSVLTELFLSLFFPLTPLFPTIRV